MWTVRVVFMIVGIADKNYGVHAHSLLAYSDLFARLHTMNNKMLSTPVWSGVSLDNSS